MEIIERIDEWRDRYGNWTGKHAAASAADVGDDYPFVENKLAPFVPARRALPMLNLALVSSAGAHIDGTEPFDVTAADGDVSFREIPVEVEAEDLRFAARGYDPKAVEEDMNALIPVKRLLEFQGNGIIGQLNPVWWSFNGFIPDAGRMTEEMLPELARRLQRYEVQAALLIPASRLCHQSVSLAARAIELAGIPTMMLAVDKGVVETVRAPRAAFYRGEFGRVAGQPNWPEFQRRILDQALRLIEPLDQPGAYKLDVILETEVENERGER
ncbi:MAG: glycine/sarcosine/betaine reductase selenoprotein B family protein [Pyrinomonadaceae bacterium]